MRRFILISFLMIFGLAQAQETPSLSKAKDFITARKFDSALLELVNLRSSPEALSLETAVLISMELTTLRLNAFAEELKMRTEKLAKPLLEKEIQLRADALLAEVELWMSRKDWNGEISVLIPNVDTEREVLKEKIRANPKLLDSFWEELRGLETAANLRGVLTGFLGKKEESDGSLVSGKLAAGSFWNALGIRLLIAHATLGNSNRLQLAKRCFERVLDSATAATESDRKRAEEFLGQARARQSEVGRPRPLIPPVKCPVDGAPMDPSWKFCPTHGVALGPPKEKS